MDYEITSSSSSRLIHSDLSDFNGEPNVCDYGAIVICRGGQATVNIDFRSWVMKKDAVITLFPNDVIGVSEATPDFDVEMLCYDPALLREASLRLEQTVYTMLRNDRFRSDDAIVSAVVDKTLDLLSLYFNRMDCSCIDSIVLYHLKAFFLGYYDRLCRSRGKTQQVQGFRHSDDLFNRFMELLEQDYKLSHNVAYYADKLSITPKYLSIIVHRMTRHTPKVIIDHFVVLQLKLTLRNTSLNIKQIAWEYHFSDTSFMCRYFKRHTGYSPHEFRKTIRERRSEGL